jgi:pyruvate dehydrogenase E2 component (dihydrolipoamide acetyltransferase)
MRNEVTMPRMGQSMDEGRVLRWLKEVGAEVKRGEVIAEIETDKTVVDMETFVSGTLVQVIVPEGELVSTGTVIAYVDDGRPEPEAILTPESAPATASPAKPAELLLPSATETPQKRARHDRRINGLAGRQTPGRRTRH